MMNSLTSVQKELEKFGLTHSQAKVYLLLVSNKELRIQEIAKVAQIPRSTVYGCLKVLFELGIAEEIVEDNYKVVRAYSVGVMHHGLDEKMLELRRLKDDLRDLEHAIKLTAPANAPGKAIVHYYKHRSGARQLFWNTLKASDTVYVCSDWGRGRYVCMKFYENFVSESRKRHIKERVLINPTAHALRSIREFTIPGSPMFRTRLEDIRALDEKVIKIKGDSLIYDNIYAHVYLRNVEIHGFEIESELFAETQRSIHETLWELARPIVEYF